VWYGKASPGTQGDTASRVAQRSELEHSRGPHVSRVTCKDGRMAKLPDGWSRPGEALRGVCPVRDGRLRHVARSAPAASGVPPFPVVWLAWSPVSAVAQPVLTLWAVPSELRQAVRRWVHDDVSARAATWFANVVCVSEVSRSMRHDTTWSWRGESLPETPPGAGRPTERLARRAHRGTAPQAPHAREAGSPGARRPRSGRP